MYIHVVFFTVSLFLLWFGSDLIVQAVRKLSVRLNVSQFATSFIILGVLTSIPELSIGINSIIGGEPDIFVGNLIGASFTLFALAIPILAIFGGGIQLAHELDRRRLAFSLIIALLPAWFVLDGMLTEREGFIVIIAYFILFYLVEKQKALLEKVTDVMRHDKVDGVVILIRILIGAGTVFIASRVIVQEVMYFANLLDISLFIVGLLILGIGTNLPELSITVQSIMKGQKDVAFGDYVGSAAANSLFFGLLILMQGPFVLSGDSFFLTFLFFSLVLLFFYSFSIWKKNITRGEGFILVLIYLIFVTLEIQACLSCL